MRRRKRRPVLQDQERITSPFFVKSKQEEAVGVLAQTIPAEKNLPSPIEAVQSEAINLLNWVCAAIRDGHSDQAAAQQSKALKLAHQMLAADIRQLEWLQDAMYQIKATIHSSKFSCGTSIFRSYGDHAKVIDLGHSFPQLNTDKQVFALIHAAIKNTSLPEFHSAPSGRYEAMNPTTAWTDYIFTLLQLLPEKPYIVTGTPTNWMPPRPEEEEEGDGNGTPDERTVILDVVAEEDEPIDSDSIKEPRQPITSVSSFNGNTPEVNNRKRNIFFQLGKWLSRKNK